jgi:hypothetical protein
MLRRSLLAGLVLTGTALADFSYQQTSRITGGAMSGMMKVAGAFSAKAREPMVSTIMLKGDRMATISGDQVNVIDLGKETMTYIDLQKKTYSVITFAEMAELMKKMAEKMSQSKKDGAEMNFRAEAKETGQSRQIAGLNTRQYLINLTMEGKDGKSGQTGAMDMQMDMWVAPAVPGYEEVRAFYERMASKVAWSPLSSMAGAFGAQNSKGMAELVKEMSKVNGVPVYQITRLGVNGTAPAGSMPSQAEMQAAQQQTQQSQAEAESARREAAANAATQGVGSAIGGRAGSITRGLGGFAGLAARRKKSEEPQQTAKAPEAPQPPPPPAAPAAPASLMEITSESSNFSSASVDGSKFEVPAGFKQTENDMKKALR